MLSYRSSWLKQGIIYMLSQSEVVLAVAEGRATLRLDGPRTNGFVDAAVSCESLVGILSKFVSVTICPFVAWGAQRGQQQYCSSFYL